MTLRLAKRQGVDHDGVSMALAAELYHANVQRAPLRVSLHEALSRRYWVGAGTATSLFFFMEHRRGAWRRQHGKMPCCFVCCRWTPYRADTVVAAAARGAERADPLVDCSWMDGAVLRHVSVAGFSSKVRLAFQRR